MTEPDRSSRLRRVGLRVLTAVLVLDLAVGVFHLTHEGVVSGVIQLIFGGLLVAAAYLIFRAGRSAGSKRRSRRAGVAMIAVMASVLFYLSFYHLTHEGLPSAIIELIMASLLVIFIYVVNQYRRGGG